MTMAPVAPTPVIIETTVNDEMTDDDLAVAHLICHCAYFAMTTGACKPTICGKQANPRSWSVIADPEKRCALCELSTSPCVECTCLGGRMWMRYLPR